MTRVGWVSLIWIDMLFMEIVEGAILGPVLAWTMDWTVADTKKYCCFRRRDFPS